MISVSIELAIRLSELKCTHFDDVNENVYLGRLFVGMFWCKRHMHTVFRRCEFFHDSSMHPIDGSVSRTFDIHNVAHFDGSADVGNKPIQSKMSYYNRSICMDARQCDIYEYGHLNPVEL